MFPYICMYGIYKFYMIPMLFTGILVIKNILWCFVKMFCWRLTCDLKSYIYFAFQGSNGDLVLDTPKFILGVVDTAFACVIGLKYTFLGLLYTSARYFRLFFSILYVESCCRILFNKVIFWNCFAIDWLIVVYRLCKGHKAIHKLLLVRKAQVSATSYIIAGTWVGTTEISYASWIANGSKALAVFEHASIRGK